MQQVALREQCQRTEDSRAVDGGQGRFQVGQTEGVAELVAHLAPDEETYGSYADTGIVKNLFVGNVWV